LGVILICNNREDETAESSDELCNFKDILKTGIPVYRDQNKIYKGI